MNNDHERIAINDNSNLYNMKPKKVTRLEKADRILSDLGITTKHSNGEYKQDIIIEVAEVFKKLDENANTEEDIQSNEIMKEYILVNVFGAIKANEVRSYINYRNGNKLEYPLPVFDNDDYCVVLNEDQTAKHTSHSATEDEKIIDLSTLTKEEILNAYYNDKQTLYSFIINKSNIDIYDISINNLLLKVDEFEQEQDDLYDKADDMIKKLKIKIIHN